MEAKSVDIAELLKEGFPFTPGLTDEQIRTGLAQIPLDPYATFPATHPDRLLLMHAGLLELSRRQLELSRRQSEDANRTSRRLAWAALVIALISSALAVIFGAFDLFGDRSWHDDQLQILTEIRDLLDP